MSKKYKIGIVGALVVWVIVFVTFDVDPMERWTYPLGHLLSSVVGYHFLRKGDRVKNNPHPAMWTLKREKKAIMICGLLGILAIPFGWFLYRMVLKEEGITDQELDELKKQWAREDERQFAARMIF